MSLPKPLFLLYFLVSFLQAPNTIASLRSVVATLKEDTTMVKAYLQFFKTDLFYENLAEVINYTYKAKLL